MVGVVDGDEEEAEEDEEQDRGGQQEAPADERSEDSLAAEVDSEGNSL